MNTPAHKKILLLITKSNWGGAQRYVYDLAVNLKARGYDVVVALGGSGVLIDKLDDADIIVEKIPGLQRDVSIIKELLSIWNLSGIIRRHKPDVLHVNSSKAGGLGSFLGRVFRVKKIVYTAHGWAFNEDRPALIKFILKFFHWLTVVLSHQTISVSAMVMEQMNWPFTKRKMTLVHNGRALVPYLHRDAARKVILEKIPTITIDPSDTWTATIAELHPIKRHDLTIDAIAKLRDKGIQFKHFIIGAGAEKKNLEEKISALGLKDQVFLVGHIDEAARLLHAFDIFILSSRSEALAYVVIEAAQAGLGVITSNVGGLPEIITNNKDGLLFESGNATSLSNALEKLLKSTELLETLSRNAKEKSKDFSIEKMLTRTIFVYESN